MTVAHTEVNDLPGRCRIAQWVLTTANPTGDDYECPGASDRTVTFTAESGGAWGGATAIMEGSNLKTIYLPLTDNGNTAISGTTDYIEVILQNPRVIRPRLSAVGIGATVTVTVFSRSTMAR